MGASTKIEWCDATLNLWWGCTKVSAGCKNCYAEAFADGRYKRGNWGPNGVRQEVKSWRTTLNKIVNRSKFLVQCSGCDRRGDTRTWEEDIRAEHPNALTCCPDRKLRGARMRVFVQSMSDTFEGPETMGGNDSLNWAVTERLREDLAMEICKHPDIDFLILTKRPENVLRWAERCMFTLERPCLPDNVWIGTSVEDQATADARIPEMLKIPAKVRFLSMEPLLNEVSLKRWLHVVSACKDLCPNWPNALGKPRGPVLCVLHPQCECQAEHNAIHWVIVGGESGPGARPFDPQDAYSLMQQCKAAGVPFFFKQMGSKPFDKFNDRPVNILDRKGAEWEGWDSLRVRQFPEVRG